MRSRKGMVKTAALLRVSVVAILLTALPHPVAAQDPLAGNG